MNNIQKMIHEQKDFSAFASAYCQYISTLLKSLDIKDLERVCNEFESARKDKTTIFIAGNGGSATTASRPQLRKSLP